MLKRFAGVAVTAATLIVAAALLIAGIRLLWIGTHH
jgi:hypothetical protein